MVPSGTDINARRATNTSRSTATSVLGWGIAVPADSHTFFFITYLPPRLPGPLEAVSEPRAPTRRSARPDRFAVNPGCQDTFSSRSTRSTHAQITIVRPHRLRSKAACSCDAYPNRTPLQSQRCSDVATRKLPPSFPPSHRGGKVSQCRY